METTMGSEQAQQKTQKVRLKFRCHDCDASWKRTVEKYGPGHYGWKSGANVDECPDCGWIGSIVGECR